MTHRFFIQPNQIKRDLIEITGTDVNHLKNVLRLKPHDKIIALDGSGTEYTAELQSISKKKVTAAIVAKREVKSEPPIKITLAQSILKGEKMDWVIQKCTELGVYKIIPMLSERTIVKPERKPTIHGRDPQSAASNKILRWQRIAKEAAEQSGGSFIPEISPIKTFEEILNNSEEYNLKLIPWELETTQSLKNYFLVPNSCLLILIGPEGGFSQVEVELAKQKGFQPVSLGKRILRAETAAVVSMAQIIYAL